MGIVYTPKPMQKFCNHSGFRVSIVNMRILAIIVLYCFISSAALGQALDPNAINLSKSLKVLETSGADYILNANCNVGLQNEDSYEDMMFGYFPDTLPDYSALRLGGSMLFNFNHTPSIQHTALEYGDFNGDGIKDIISSVYGLHPFFNKGLGVAPYFDSLPRGAFRFKSFPADIIIVGAGDFNGDGIKDLFCTVENLVGVGSYYTMFTGGKNFNQSTIYPDDSLDGGSFVHGAKQYTDIVGKFGKNLPYMYLISVVDRTVAPDILKTGLVRLLSPLSKDTVEWFTRSDRDSDVISPKVMYVMDITNDGIPDLLAVDGTSIYIFKGGDDFGTYPLTKKNAYFIIHSPKDLDVGYFALEGFGGYMRNCGDMSGSGVPYLMVTASVNKASYYYSYAFFYAGGKALDTKFDAFIKEERFSAFPIDTLHSIDGSGRTACIFQSLVNAGGDFDELLYEDCDKIPHVTNPDLGGVPIHQTENNDLSAIAFPAIAQNFVKIRITSTGHFTNGILTVNDILGRIMVSRSVSLSEGENLEYIDLHNYPSGSYSIQVKTDKSQMTTRFVVRK